MVDDNLLEEIHGIANALEHGLGRRQSVDDCGRPLSNTPEALECIAHELRRLGAGDASDHRGAIEVLAISVSEAGEKIAGANGEIASAIFRLAEVVEDISIKLGAVSSSGKSSE